MKTLKIDDKWSVEYDPANNDKPVELRRYDECVPRGLHNWKNDSRAMFYALLEARQVRNETAEADRPLEARQVRNETAEADRPLEPQTEGTHIHAALLAQESTGLFVAGLNAEEMEELRVLGQRTGGLIEFNPGKRKPMDSAGDLIRNYPDLATDLAADDEFTASFLNALTVELADAVIRILDLAVSRMAIERASGKIETCDGYDHHPFGTVLIEKMEFNANREDHKVENRRGPNGKRF